MIIYPTLVPALTLGVAQPTTCITSQFTSTGSSNSKKVQLKLTNQCTAAVDFQNSTVTFENTASLNTNFWGNFGSLTYPDNALNISSQKITSDKYLSTFNLHFPSYGSAQSKLSVGSSITIKYSVSADKHVEESTKVYLSGTSPQTGNLTLKNNTAKPAQVSQAYATVHVSLNGQNIKDVQLPWSGSLGVSGLAIGNYNISADTLSDTQGNSYQGTATPSTVAVKLNQTVTSTITYQKVQQLGKIILNLQALPNELSGYTSTPTVVITNQAGNSVSKSLAWNAPTTVDQLKANTAYQFSTPTINYNGYNCSPTFSPTSVIAGVTPSTSNLTFNCVLVAQDNISVTVTGASPTLTSLNVNFTPNNNSTVITKTVALSNGSGTDSVLLTDGFIYTVSADNVSGTVQFSPQPLTATPNASETITITAQTEGTPVATNGQLTVCGTQLCNDQGTPIQLKGMSTHGLQWYGLGTCLTTASLDYLTNNMKANVLRLSMYVQEGGYESNPTAFTQQVNTLINEAYNRGIYVIVDWHILNPGDPNYNLTRAKKFFSDIIAANGTKNNLLYEIANEPNGVSWATIKSYADQIIPYIRALDPKAPIIVGTRGWSSLGVSDGSSYQEIVNNPVQYPNIMYTFHFYAASHKDQYLNALDNASNVLPIFVTEFGTQTTSGDGNNDFVMSDRYMQLMASKKIGWANWNYSDDFRSGAVWITGTCAKNVWTDSALKPAGIYVKGKIINP